MLLSSIRHSWTHVEGNKWRTPYRMAKNGYRIGYTMYAIPCKRCKELCMVQCGKKYGFCSKGCWGIFRKWFRSKNPAWKGGKTVNPVSGYEYTRDPSHPNAGSLGYVPTHRYVMSKHLGRTLRKNEIVHHINHNKRDNRIQNLVILTKHKHNSYHANKFWETHKLIVVPK